MNKTPIEWCRTYAADGSFEEGYSVNPVRFRPRGSSSLRTMCQKVSPGCAHCYAEGITRRFWPKNADVAFPGYTALGVVSGEFVLDEAMLLRVLRHKKPTKIFWGDMTDLFQESVPDAFLDRCFAVAALTPHITHMFLTKRAERMRAYFTGHYQTYSPGPREMVFNYVKGLPGYDGEHPRWWKFAANVFDVLPLPNVWLGISVENQEQADKRIPELLQTPAAVRFISAEPLIASAKLLWKWVSKGRPFDGGPQVNVLEPWKEPVEMPGLDWVIVGGESGAGARPMHPDWVRSLRDQCVAAGVPFFFKQWGEWLPFNQREAGQVSDSVAFETAYEGSAGVWKVGKDATAVREDLISNGKPGWWRVGKKAAGALLDGREWREFPEVRS